MKRAALHATMRNQLHRKLHGHLNVQAHKWIAADKHTHDDIHIQLFSQLHTPLRKHIKERL